MRNILLMLFLFFIGCSEPQTQVANSATYDCEDNGYVNVQEWRREVLHIDSVKFNGEIFLINSIGYYKKLFGKEILSYPIENEDVSIYGNKQDDKIRYVFEGVVVDQLGGEGIINTLDFSKLNGHLDANGLILKNGTKVADICEVFPRSCRLIPSNGNVWSGFIELKAHTSGLDFRRIFLIFQREELKKLKIVNLGY